MKEQLKEILQDGAKIYFSSMKEKGLPSNHTVQKKAIQIFNDMIAARVDKLSAIEVASYMDIFSKLSSQKVQQANDFLISSFLGLNTPDGQNIGKRQEIVDKVDKYEAAEQTATGDNLEPVT